MMSCDEKKCCEMEVALFFSELVVKVGFVAAVGVLRRSEGWLRWHGSPHQGISWHRGSVVAKMVIAIADDGRQNICFKSVLSGFPS